MRFKRVLDPIDRVLEVLAGIIMVLTFTTSLSVSQAGKTDVHEMLIGALGCNIAWGIIDAIMYVMSSLAARGSELKLWRELRSSSGGAEAQRIIAAELPEPIASAIDPAVADALRKRLEQLPEFPVRAELARDDWLGAVSVFLLVFLSTFPVALPFIFIREPALALRLSNLIAVVMLFLTGYLFARYAGRRPWVTGVIMVLLGSILTGVAIAFGG